METGKEYVSNIYKELVVWNIWVLDSMQERFHNTSPGNFESTFVKAVVSKTKEELKIEKARS